MYIALELAMLASCKRALLKMTDATCTVCQKQLVYMNKSCKFAFLTLLSCTFYSNGRQVSAGKIIGLCALRFTVTQFCKTKFKKLFSLVSC